MATQNIRIGIELKKIYKDCIVPTSQVVFILDKEGGYALSFRPEVEKIDTFNIKADSKLHISDVIICATGGSERTGGAGGAIHIIPTNAICVLLIKPSQLYVKLFYSKIHKIICAQVKRISENNYHRSMIDYDVKKGYDLFTIDEQYKLHRN